MLSCVSANWRAVSLQLSYFSKYGEEPNAYLIAKSICKAREIKPIETTFDLVEVIKNCLPQKVLNKKGHPAKQVFQALRIAVNDELQVFEKSLLQAIKIAKIGGRIAVISFHSLEDRIAKHTFKEYSEIKVPKNLPIVVKDLAPLKLITRHPILPSEEELAEKMGITVDKVREVMKISQDPVSLETPIGEEEDDPLTKALMEEAERMNQNRGI